MGQTASQTTKSWRRCFLLTTSVYLSTALASILIFCWTFKLWQANLRIPLTFSYDAIFFETLIKGIRENGWYLNNYYLGAPGSLQMYDFPGSDALNFAIIKFIALFTTDAGLIFNLFYIFTFPAVSLSALYVFRQFRFSNPVSVLLSLLYAFLPYHLYHGQWHLTLSAYFMIPLICLIILRVSGAKRGAVTSFAANNQEPKQKISWRVWLPALIVCLLVASTGWGYYAFLSCFFLLLAGIRASVQHKQARHLIAATSLIVAVIFGLLLNLAPSLIHTARYGSSKIAERRPADAEVYGLKLTQMLLPVTGHRLASLAAFKDHYNQQAPLVNENDFVTLGLLGSTGLLFTLLSLFNFRRLASDEGSFVETLGVLNLSALLLGTIGGFSSLFTYTLFSQIRVFNRISIFIAFFSFLAVGICLEKIRLKLAITPARKTLWHLLLGLILVLGMLDQTTPRLIPDYKTLAAEDHSDSDFVQRVEKMMPPGAMIFQLPYVDFPESPRYYELFRGYLHSKNLRWSYASMRGSPSDLWVKAVSEQNPDELVQTLALSDFSGIYLDRAGFANHAADLEQQLTRLLGKEPIVSANHRLSFFSLVELKTKLESSHTPEQLARLREVARHPLFIKWGKGFYDAEHDANDNWRWCSGAGELQIFNGTHTIQNARLEFHVATGFPEPFKINIEGAALHEQLSISDNQTPISRQITLQPGENIIRFSSDARKVEAPSDPRLMVFRVMNFKLDQHETALRTP